MSKYTILSALSAFDLKNSLSYATLSEESPLLSQKIKSLDNEIADQTSKFGRWNYDEQILYIEFVKNYPSCLENKNRRRSTKVFKQMAKIINTRTADQCRSHHQKMQKKYGKIQSILLNCTKFLYRLKNRKNPKTSQGISVFPSSKISSQSIKERSIKIEKSLENQIDQQIRLIEDSFNLQLSSEQEHFGNEFQLKTQNFFFEFFDQGFQMLM